jgi:hypothetical protein
MKYEGMAEGQWVDLKAAWRMFSFEERRRTYQQSDDSGKIFGIWG